MLDAKPMALPAVKPASQAPAAGAAGAAAAKAPEPAKGKGNFRIQIGAESDVDAAQAKKAEYEKLLGGAVDMVFDAPYYKLRWGYFDTKQDAEDKLLELSDLKIQGFVVKQDPADPRR
jgi:septal ring-binding cell division protein DamX